MSSEIDLKRQPRQIFAAAIYTPLDKLLFVLLSLSEPLLPRTAFLCAEISNPKYDELQKSGEKNLEHIHLCCVSLNNLSPIASHAACMHREYIA
jgi:hypothetical protein